jgi:uncharacterized protein (TIGR02678 family)
MKNPTPEYYDCIQALLDNFWILRKDDAELFTYIKEYENNLRDYFKETFRFKLIVESHFAKVEKFQVRPTSAVTISGFKHVKDYVMFFCLLYFLEGKNERQFAISDVCDVIVAQFPSKINKDDGTVENERITWVEAGGYQNRLALIRVLKEAEKRNLLFVIDKNIEDFGRGASNDALLRSTGLVKYFIRNYGFNIAEANHLNDVISLQEAQEKNLGVEMKHLIYRRLFLEPVCYKHELGEDVFTYLKQYGHHVNDHAERHYDMYLERYTNSVMLTKRSVSRSEKVFPSDNAESNVMVQFSTLLREKIENNEIDLRNDGVISLTSADFDKIIEELKTRNDKAWTSEFNKKSMEALKSTILEFLLSWKFAEVLENHDIIIYDGIGRVTEKKMVLSLF